MAISYAWSFPTLDVVYSEDGFSNVVQTVHWIYTAKDGEYTASTYSTVSLPAPGQPFINYNNLTPAIVEGWVVNTLGQETVNAMKASLAANIQDQKTPKSGSLQPPWVK